MLRRCLILVTAVVLASQGVAATAQAKKTIKFTWTTRMATVSPTGVMPIVQAGDVKAKRRTGAEVDRVMLTGFPTPTTFTWKGTGVTYWTDGSTRGTFSGTSTIRPDGSQVMVGTGRFTGGTGVYRGATGGFTATGLTPAGSSVTTQRITGTMRLP